MTKYALTRREKQRHTPLHPTPLPSSHLPSPFPHSSAFPTFGQKKRLENEPEKKGPGRSKLSRRRPGPGEGPGRTRSQGEESQREGERENKELEPERRRARQRARQKQRNGCKLTVRAQGCAWCRQSGHGIKILWKRKCTYFGVIERENTGATQAGPSMHVEQEGDSGWNKETTQRKFSQSLKTYQVVIPKLSVHVAALSTNCRWSIDYELTYISVTITVHHSTCLSIIYIAILDNQPTLR